MAHHKDRKRAYADVANTVWDARQHLAAIVESSDDAIISKDLNGIISSWNQAAERLFGYGPAEAIGQPITLIIPVDRIGEEAEIIGKIRQGERIEHFETVRRRKDGRLIELSITVSPVKDAQGKIVGASKIARDISERRRAEEQRELLVGEMKHRTKNFAAIIDAIARQSRPKNNPEAAALLDAFVGRLRVLMISGGIVVESAYRRAALRDIFEQVLAPFENSKDNPSIALTGPEVEVSEQTAGSLALAVHELATNALKYGALKSPDGRVTLRWMLESSGLVRVEWKETANLQLSAQPTRVGFGSRVIRSALSHDREATSALLFEPDGVRCTFVFHIQ